MECEVARGYRLLKAKKLKSLSLKPQNMRKLVLSEKAGSNGGSSMPKCAYLKSRYKCWHRDRSFLRTLELNW